MVRVPQSQSNLSQYFSTHFSGPSIYGRSTQLKIWNKKCKKVLSEKKYIAYKIRITLHSEMRESLDCYSLNEEGKKKKGRKGMVGYQLGYTHGNAT